MSSATTNKHSHRFPSLLVTGVASIGDALMSLPAVRRVAENCCPGRLVVLAPALTAPIYARCGVPHTLHVLPAGTGSVGIVRALLREKRERHAAAVLLGGGFVWALGARLAGIPRRVGLAADNRAWLLTDALRLDAEAIHETESFLRVAASLCGGAAAPQAPQLCLGGEDRNGAAQLLVAHLLADQPWFAVGPGASHAYKQWPRERFVALLDAVQQETGWGCVLLGGIQDQALCHELAAAAAGPVQNLAGTTSLPLTAALLERARFFVGNNSGLVHLAAAVGTRTLCLSGPSNVEKTRPLGTGHHVLSGNPGETVRARPLGHQGPHPSLLAVSVEAALKALWNGAYLARAK